MQNRTFLVVLRSIFSEKLKIAPPIGKQPPFKRLDIGVGPNNQSQTWRRPFIFIFWRPPDFGRKKALNLRFRPKIQSQNRRRPFFFWRPPDFGRKKALNFRAFREISSQFSCKPSETHSRAMKIRVKVVCTLLTLSK